MNNAAAMTRGDRRDIASGKSSMLSARWKESLRPHRKNYRHEQVN